MAVQPYLYLVMTDGTDTVTIADGAGTVGSAGYALVDPGWAPQVAGIRRSLLGGYGPYADVEEEITIDIFDTTAANCYTKLDTLVRLLDKAKRWWLRGELISPVVLKWVPQGSTVHASGGTVMQAIVMGMPGDEEVNGTAVESDFEHTGFLFEISNIKIRILRRGPWTGATDTVATSGTFANGAVMTRAFASTYPISSPMDVTIGGFDKTATPTIKAGYLMVGSNASDITLVSPPGSNVAGWTSVADAANLAMFGNVIRYTPTGTATSNSGAISLGGSVSGPCAIIAAVRNNSVTTTWLISMSLVGASGTVRTPTVAIDNSTTNPRLVYLGTVSGTGFVSMLTTATASAAAGSLDFNYAYVVNLRDETVNVIAHDDINVSLISSGAVTLQALFNPVTDANPRLLAVGTASSPSLTYRGPLPFQSIGINVYAVWVATNNNYWRMTNNVNAIVNVTLDVDRYRSYLSPL